MKLKEFLKIILLINVFTFHYYQIECSIVTIKQEGYCLDPDLSRSKVSVGFGTRKNEKIVYCNEAKHQKWKLIEKSSGFIVFQSKTTKECLDSNWAGNVYSHVCNDGFYQEWELIDKNLLKNKATGKCLTTTYTVIPQIMANGVVNHYFNNVLSTNDCTGNINNHIYAGHFNQEWIIEKHEEYIHVKISHSNKPDSILKLGLINKDLRYSFKKEYIGCYEDWWLFKRRDLNGKSFDSDDMSIENCAKFCLDHKYFGLQNKNECYCGNSDKRAYGPIDRCNKKCSNSRGICGGFSANSIYQISKKTYGNQFCFKTEIF